MCILSRGQSSSTTIIPYASANLVPNSNESSVMHGATIDPTISLSLSLGLSLSAVSFHQATTESIKASIGNVGDKTINNGLSSQSLMVVMCNRWQCFARW
jgi:hypothetical protein